MKLLSTLIATAALTFGASAYAETETYAIDTQGAHAFIQFKVSHLGYSYIYGRFNEFDGSFTTDSEDFSQSSVTLNINPASIDSNHAERDKHLRGKKFLNVDKFAEAGFVSTKITPLVDGEATITGDLTLGGVTKSIDIDVTKVGEGKDPWGGYRKGFEGTTSIKAQDFGLGPGWLGEISFDLVLEGIRK